MISYKFLNQKRTLQSPIFKSEDSFEENSSLKIKYLGITQEEIDYMISNEHKMWYKSSTQITIPLELSLFEYNDLDREFKPNTKLPNFKNLINYNDEEHTKIKLKEEDNEYKTYSQLTKCSTIQPKLIKEYSNRQFKKYNIVLGLCNTIIDITTKKNKHLNVMEVHHNEHIIEINYKFRPYLFEFFRKLEKYFNFYISSLSAENLSKIIVEKINKEVKVEFKKIITIKNKPSNEAKIKRIKEIFPLSNLEDLHNTIIIDNNVKYWINNENINKEIEQDITQCIRSLIPSKRYEIESFNKQNYDILIHNDIIDKPYDQNKNYTISVDPNYCLDYYNGYESLHEQLFYIYKFIKKCVRYNKYYGESLVRTMDYYRKMIFKECRFNFININENNKNNLSKIIEELGGKIVSDKRETTHYIVDLKNISNEIQKEIGKIYINQNYIYQCYFNLYKFEEYRQEFNPFLNK